MKTEIIQKLLLMIVTWLIQYLDGFHIRRNPGKRNTESETMNTDGKVVE